MTTISMTKLFNAANGRAPFAALPDPPEAKAIRQQAGISRHQLAQVVGTSHVSIWRWENGVTTPMNWIVAARYARALTYLEKACAHAERAA